MSHSGASKHRNKPGTTDNLVSLIRQLHDALQSDEFISKAGASGRLLGMKRSAAIGLLILNYQKSVQVSDLDWDPHSDEALQLPLAGLVEAATKEEGKNWAYHVAFNLGKNAMISANHPDLEKEVNGKTVMAWLHQVG